MARYNDGTRYNSGAVYGPLVAAVTKPMAKIKIDVTRLSVAQKLIKSAEFVNLGTGNTNVPGNAALITALAAAQTALETAECAAEEARTLAKQRTADRDAALEVWTAAVNSLAAFTQSATGGDAGKILSAGFDIRKTPAPVPTPEAVTGVTVEPNGAPGYSSVSWNGAAGADGYIVQGSPDPITATSWQTPVISKKTKAEANGASPGEKYWYRVAAFNSGGQSPWSEPAGRPVM